VGVWVGCCVWVCMRVGGWVGDCWVLVCVCGWLCVCGCGRLGVWMGVRGCGFVGV
jgi:hypothetical protein